MFASGCSRSRSERRSGVIRAAVLAGTATLAATTAGCAARQGMQLPDMDGWDQRVAVLGGLDDWEFRGRVGVRAGDDGFNGRLRWVQRDDRYSATLSGPLGVGTVRLDGAGRRVELTDKDGVRTVLDNAETELYLRYGWTLPVTSLRYWALGIPDPAFVAATEFDADGALVRLEQAGWNVEISDYSSGGGQSMPRKLTATGPDTRVRVVIDDWRF